MANVLEFCLPSLMPLVMDMVVFDNSYSYLRNKKLHYSIQVTPPIKISMLSDEEVVVKDI
uniref:GOLD domain-containing protein n=1 Tax=Timema poppense TaxID=170557 RepID=A0A7R9GUE7_TIMPO|nr:unnamed protein product [Timema poppensis]